MQKHTLSLLVDNKPDSFARVIGLISAKGYSISSLLVSETEVPTVAQLKIVVNVTDEYTLNQIIKNLNRLVVTISVSKENSISFQNMLQKKFSLN